MGEPATTTTGGLLRTMRDFARAFADHAGRRGVPAVALVAGGALIEGAGLLLIVPILGLVFGSSAIPAFVPGAAWVMGLAQPVRLALLLAMFVAVMMLRGVILYARDMELSALQIGFVETARNRVMRALADAPWERVALLRHAEITNLMSGEIGRIATTAHYGVQALVAAVMLAIQLVIVALLSPVMAGVAALLIALGAVLVLVRQRRVHDMGIDVVRSSQAMMGSAGAFLGGLKAAAAEHAADRFVHEFEDVHRDLRTTQLAFLRRQARARRTFAGLSALAAVSVVLGGAALQTAPGVLVTLIIVFSRMSGPSIQIQQAAQNIAFGLPSFEAVRALEATLAVPQAARVTPIAPPDGPIMLDRATYAHPGGGGIHEVTLTIAPGCFLGIAGPSGAGKTSLVDLICGLVTPGAGSILVGGVVLDAATRAGWRQSVGYVPQDGFLFNDTVRRNLDWSAAIDDERIADMLALTGADRVVAALDQGLDTIVGERGVRLSGGERQRLALARALLRRPRLLVLDEATNAIDIAGEAELLARLAALTPRPTILMVAHRAQSLAHCDRVITVRNGRLADNAQQAVPR